MDERATVGEGGETQRARGLRVAIDGSNLRSGGAITHITELIRHGDPAAHGITEVTLWGGAATLSRVPQRPWLNIVRLPQLDRSLWRRVLWQLFERPRLLEGYDVLFAPAAAPPRGFRPYVSMSHNMLPFAPRERARYGLSVQRLRMALLRRVQEHAFRRSSVVVYLTEFARRTIGGHIASKVPSIIIPHGIGDEFRHQPSGIRPLSSHTTADAFRFVYVSDFELYKHQWVVAEAVCRLRAQGLPVTLDLIGEPRNRRALALVHEILARFPGAEEIVHIRGSIPHEDLPRIYRETGAFVFASTCENLPVTLLEAMAAGLPIASSSTPPMPDLLGKAALYFDAESTESVERTLRTIAEDHELRAGCARHAFEAARGYSWKACADRTFALLADVARQG